MTDSTVQEWYVLNNDFVAQLKDQITCLAGDKVKLVSTFNEGWCTVRTSLGQIGQVPTKNLDKWCGNQEERNTDVGKFKRSASKVFKRANSIKGIKVSSTSLKNSTTKLKSQLTPKKKALKQDSAPNITLSSDTVTSSGGSGKWGFLKNKILQHKAKDEKMEVDSYTPPKPPRRMKTHSAESKVSVGESKVSNTEDQQESHRVEELVVTPRTEELVETPRTNTSINESCDWDYTALNFVDEVPATPQEHPSDEGSSLSGVSEVQIDALPDPPLPGTFSPVRGGLLHVLGDEARLGGGLLHVLGDEARLGGGLLHVRGDEVSGSTLTVVALTPHSSHNNLATLCDDILNKEELGEILSPSSSADHVTPDTSHVTHDTSHVTESDVSFSDVPAPPSFTPRSKPSKRECARSESTRSAISDVSEQGSLSGHKSGIHYFSPPTTEDRRASQKDEVLDTPRLTRIMKTDPVYTEIVDSSFFGGVQDDDVISMQEEGQEGQVSQGSHPKWDDVARRAKEKKKRDEERVKKKGGKGWFKSKKEPPGNRGESGNHGNRGESGNHGNRGESGNFVKRKELMEEEPTNKDPSTNPPPRPKRLVRQKTLDKHSSNPGNTAEECSTTEESLKTAEECTTTEYHTADSYQADTLGDVVSLHNDDTRGSDPEIQNLVTPADVVSDPLNPAMEEEEEVEIQRVTSGGSSDTHVTQDTPTNEEEEEEEEELTPDEKEEELDLSANNTLSFVYSHQLPQNSASYFIDVAEDHSSVQVGKNPKLPLKPTKDSDEEVFIDRSEISRDYGNPARDHSNTPRDHSNTPRDHSNTSRDRENPRPESAPGGSGGKKRKSREYEGHVTPVKTQSPAKATKHTALDISPTSRLAEPDTSPVIQSNYEELHTELNIYNGKPVVNSVTVLVDDDRLLEPSRMRSKVKKQDSIYCDGRENLRTNTSPHLEPRPDTQRRRNGTSEPEEDIETDSAVVAIYSEAVLRQPVLAPPGGSYNKYTRSVTHPGENVRPLHLDLEPPHSAPPRPTAPPITPSTFLGAQHYDIPARWEKSPLPGPGGWGGGGGAVPPPPPPGPPHPPALPEEWIRKQYDTDPLCGVTPVEPDTPKPPALPDKTGLEGAPPHAGRGHGLEGVPLGYHQKSKPGLYPDLNRIPEPEPAPVLDIKLSATSDSEPMPLANPPISYSKHPPAKSRGFLGMLKKKLSSSGKKTKGHNLEKPAPTRPPPRPPAPPVIRTQAEVTRHVTTTEPSAPAAPAVTSQEGALQYEPDTKPHKEGGLLYPSLSQHSPNPPPPPLLNTNSQIFGTIPQCPGMNPTTPFMWFPYGVQASPVIQSGAPPPLAITTPEYPQAEQCPDTSKRRKVPYDPEVLSKDLVRHVKRSCGLNTARSRTATRAIIQCLEESISDTYKIQLLSELLTAMDTNYRTRRVRGREGVVEEAGREVRSSKRALKEERILMKYLSQVLEILEEMSESEDKENSDTFHMYYQLANRLLETMYTKISDKTAV